MFFSNTKNSVSIPVFLSDLETARCSIPQGSTFRVLLYFYSKIISNAFKYGDNSNLLYANINIQNIEEIMNAELTKTCQMA